MNYGDAALMALVLYYMKRNLNRRVVQRHADWNWVWLERGYTRDFVEVVW